MMTSDDHEFLLVLDKKELPKGRTIPETEVGHPVML